MTSRKQIKMTGQKNKQANEIAGRDASAARYFFFSGGLQFRFTQERLQAEAMWRKRVEAKLTPESD